jgi:hypothetical protein
MFHRSCVAFRTSLLARIGDLESENQRLVDKLLEERTEAARRELELVDRVLAVANPLAARAVMVARSISSTSPLPVVGREKEAAAAAAPLGPRRTGVRPVLNPTASGFRPLTDLMDRQRQRVVERVTTAAEGPVGAAEAAEAAEAEAPTDDLSPAV